MAEQHHFSMIWPLPRQPRFLVVGIAVLGQNWQHVAVVVDKRKHDGCFKILCGCGCSGSNRTSRRTVSLKSTGASNQYVQRLGSAEIDVPEEPTSSSTMVPTDKSKEALAESSDQEEETK